MPIDVRIPIGSLFGVLGLILFLYGVITGMHTAPGHLNAVWGGIMFVFGGVLNWFGQRAHARQEQEPT